MTKARKVAIVLLVAILILAFNGAFLCPDRSRQGRTFEQDGWTLFRFNRSNQAWSRSVNLVSLNDPDLVVDGVLVIPERVGRHTIDGFGGGAPDWPRIFLGQGVYKVVVPASVNVGAIFWEMYIFGGAPDLRYVELLCSTFDNIVSFSGSTPWWKYHFHYSGNHIPRDNPKLIIIPDGSTENFFKRMEELELRILPTLINFVEKSNFGGI